MEIFNILTSIDKEIDLLQRAKSLLLDPSESVGRIEKKVSSVTKPGKAGKRFLSPEALERIKEGQRRRWAKTKQTA